MPAGHRSHRALCALVVVAAASLLLAPLASPACTRIGPLRMGDDCRKPPPPRPDPAPGDVDRDAERELLAAANRERAARGLRRLRPDARAAEVARAHARRMSAEGRLHHNRWLGTAEGRRALGFPSALGENVGVGPSPGSVHRAFMSSTVHRRVMLRPWYRAGGFGVVRDGPRVWVVEIFLAPALGADGARAAASSGATLEAPDPALSWAALMAGDGDLAAGPFGDRSGAPPPSSLWVSALLLWLAVAAGHAARTIARRR